MNASVDIGDQILIHGLQVFARHGVNAEEKWNGQLFVLDIALDVDLSVPARTDDLRDTVNYAAVVKTVTAAMTAATYDLIERAAGAVMDALFAAFPAVRGVTLTLKKPNAPIKAVFDTVAVSVTRRREEAAVPGRKTAYLALGANLGDRAANLRAALGALAALPDTDVTKVSRVYETRPVLPEGSAAQPNFYNAAAELSTGLSPHALLGASLGIEAALGRRRNAPNAARIIDVDVLLYEGFSSSEPELCVPHPRMRERAFVLSPLSDILKDDGILADLAKADSSGIVGMIEETIA